MPPLSDLISFLRLHTKNDDYEVCDGYEVCDVCDGYVTCGVWASIYSFYFYFMS
jgi:hypothetical protein